MRNTWSLPIVKIVDDPRDPNRVIVTDIAGNRANCELPHLAGVLVFADDIDLSGTTRIGWDG